MDILKLRIMSKLMKGVIVKRLRKMIYNKFGYKIDIKLNDIQFDLIDGEVKMHLDIDSKMNKDEFERLLENLYKD